LDLETAEAGKTVAGKLNLHANGTTRANAAGRDQDRELPMEILEGCM